MFNDVVAERIIRASCQIDYPLDRLEIQVLDDSTDETRGVAEQAVRRNAARGIDITYLHRTDRTGNVEAVKSVSFTIAVADNCLTDFNDEFNGTTLDAGRWTVVRRDNQFLSVETTASDGPARSYIVKRTSPNWDITSTAASPRSRVLRCTTLG